MRVLATGSNGFVAQWLLRYLESQGDQVVGGGAEVDVTDATALTAAITAAAPDAICHLAAQSSVGASWADRAATYQVNTLGALHVVEAALACNRPPRVLLISSAEVYGHVRPEDLPLGEDRPFAPVSPYAASKAAAELDRPAGVAGRGAGGGAGPALQPHRGRDSGRTSWFPPWPSRWRRLLPAAAGFSRPGTSKLVGISRTSAMWCGPTGS